MMASRLCERMLRKRLKDFHKLQKINFHNYLGNVTFGSLLNILAKVTLSNYSVLNQWERATSSASTKLKQLQKSKYKRDHLQREA